MKILKEQVDNELKFFIEGEIDSITSKEFMNAIQKELSIKNSGGVRIEKLILDFEKVTYISSAGLRVLLLAKQWMSSKKGVVVININDAVRDIFQKTGFITMIDIR